MPFEIIAAAALLVGCTYLVFGMTGFGSTVLALPILVYLMPLKFAVSLLLMLDIVAAVFLSARARRGVRLDELGVLAPFLLVGIALGLTLLIGLPERPLLAVLGGFLVCYAIYGVARRSGALRLSRAWSVPFGVTGGAFSAMFGTGGVLLSLYVAGRIEDKSELRATTAAVVLFNSCIRIVAFGASGLLSQPGLPKTALLLLPAMLAGVYAGTRLHARVPTAVVVRAVYAIVGIAGASLLLRVLVLQ